MVKKKNIDKKQTFIHKNNNSLTLSIFCFW